MNFSKEELKTAIGHLQLDLRGNWGWDYKERLEELISLLNLLDNEDGEVYSLIATAQGEIDDPSDGRIFRGGYLYGYESEEGRTQEVMTIYKMFFLIQKIITLKYLYYIREIKS